MSTSSETNTNTSEKNRGLILPSHPNFPIKSVMAPMVAASDYPFRYFLRHYCNVDMCFTQMLHSKNFVHDMKFRQSHLDLYEHGVPYDPSQLSPTQIDCLGNLPIPQGPPPSSSTDNKNNSSNNNNNNEPLIVQIAGNDVNLALKQAEMLLDHTDGNLHGIDLNCGCPQGIARKGNYGAFLMEREEDTVCEILKALRHYLPPSTAVSAKIRLPLDDNQLQRRISKLVDTTGIDFLTIHGRTLKENKTKVGPCHIDRIRLAIETAHSVRPDFPVIANGGMENYYDFKTILQETGAVAGMSSESLLETPNIFMEPSSLGDNNGMSPRQLLHQQLGFARDYLKVCAEIVPPLPGVLGMAKNKGGSFSMVRGHLIKFLHRYLQEHIDLRDELTASGSIRTIEGAQEFVTKLESRYIDRTDAELAALQSSSPQSSWYRRHRKPSRHVHEREIYGLKIGGSSTSFNSMQGGGALPVDERKQQIKDRLQKLKAQKKERQKETARRFV